MNFLTYPAIVFAVIIAFTSCSKDPKPNQPVPGKKPEILSFAPARGLPGSTVTLTGKNFSVVKQNNEVSFNGVSSPATVLTATATQLSVVVPAAAATGKIKLQVGSETSLSATEFTVDQDLTALTDFSPKNGPFGTLVTIHGRKFGANIEVSINTIEADVVTKNATEITFRVPVNTTLTTHKIRLVSDGTVFETAENFVVTSTGPYAQWIKKNFNGVGANVFQFGLSFVHKNKIYWGFSKLTFNQTQIDYLILDPSVTNPQWVFGPVPPADMAPLDLQNATAVVLNNKVYFGTGLSPTPNAKWWVYDPETNTSNRLTDYPEPTTNALSFIFNGKIYVGFGGVSKKLHEFNPAANSDMGSWTHIADAPVREMGSSSAMVIDNVAFLGRGIPEPNGERKAFFKFQGGNSITPITGMTESVQSPQTPSFVKGGKGYFVTNTKVWEYTPGADGGAWRIVVSTDNSPAIKYTAQVNVNNLPVIYGWTSAGEVYEFKIN